MEPAVFKQHQQRYQAEYSEKRDARDVVKAFQCARLISYYLNLDKHTVVSSTHQNLELTRFKLHNVTASPESVLKENFAEEFKYLLSNPAILHPLRQGVIQHVPQQFEQGTAALFSRFDKLLQYLTRVISQ
jgi:hypothetical protein